MLQAIGLTSTPRSERPPAVDDLTFEARPGAVTALLGPSGSGKTTALRLMLELEPGRGITYFRGRPLHRIARPSREVGVLLGDVPGHPSRTLRGQLRMLCAATGVPSSRAEELLRSVGLAGLERRPIGTLPIGADRRLGLASALLGDPHTLLLDEPGAGLAASESAWLYEFLRAHASGGGTVLYTTADPKDAVRNADRVVTLDGGRLVAAQETAEFARTRLRPRVTVRTPHAARLASVVAQEARAARRPVEVVAEDGNRLSVYGSDCASVGDTAFRHGVPVHHLADETGDTGTAGAPGTDAAAGIGQGAQGDGAHGEPAAGPHATAPVHTPTSVAQGVETPSAAVARDVPAEPPVTARRPMRSPLRPLRYEVHRLLGVPSTPLVVAGVLLVSVTFSLLLGRSGRTALPAVLAGWSAISPLPPAALGAGLLGAFSFAEEYRHPALTTGRGAVPRRPGLLFAKLAVAAAVALLLGALVVAVDLGALRLFYGTELIPVPRKWPTLCANWLGLLVGCAWAGVLGAGVFRAAAAGVAAVLAVPVAFVPLLQKVLTGPSVRSAAGLPSRLREFVGPHWSPAVDRWLTGALRVLGQPAGVALSLTLTGLFCAYVFTGLRRRARW
ncbi:MULTISPECIES: ABC transporter ATP-binding protein [unclassified Streptomyces]|uniref:ATP-binding cassette domain-containing protein n=1 Tax=unclassified Streptomyces TaxID=2593676 RepID=UPI0006AEDE5B|nr:MULTISPECIES: ABC transporter ATP-binding protein [unclassified Streptomyces]KOX27147.1 ABC transporter ATP-binding protein [Streptomyces sp. NRRL F-6491]KOX40228.1 ABC transporter ATP-binding protein [Streptomyces sp. NRRL F-6492]